jgi:hypothetical protein
MTGTWLLLRAVLARFAIRATRIIVNMASAYHS